jgi:hypothetical protein
MLARAGPNLIKEYCMRKMTSEKAWVRSMRNSGIMSQRSYVLHCKEIRVTMRALGVATVKEIKK